MLGCDLSRPKTRAELLFDHTTSISENISWDVTVFCTNYFDEMLMKCCVLLQIQTEVDI